MELKRNLYLIQISGLMTKSWSIYRSISWLMSVCVLTFWLRPRRLQRCLKKQHTTRCCHLLLGSANYIWKSFTAVVLWYRGCLASFWLILKSDDYWHQHSFCQKSHCIVKKKVFASHQLCTKIWFRCNVWISLFFSRPLFVSLYVFFFVLLFLIWHLCSFFCADAERDCQWVWYLYVVSDIHL